MSSSPITISFGGGKGGIGKSSIVCNTGALLSQKKYSVGFIDADLGGANLHLCLGVKRPRHTLHDFLSGNVKTLEELFETTCIPNSWLISGASDILDLANPHFSQKQKLIGHLSKVAADYVLLDLAAGTHNHVADFFAAFNNGVVIIDNLPTSIENAYGFIKNGIIRGISRLFPAREDIKKHLLGFTSQHGERSYATLQEMFLAMKSSCPEEARICKEWLAQRKTFLILNMVKSRSDIEVGKKFIDIIKKYLGITIVYLGYIIYDTEMRRSIREMKPIVINNPSEDILHCFQTITDNIISLTQQK